MVHRIERVNHLIRQEISELLRREVKDPRLNGIVSITQVETSADGRYRSADTLGKGRLR